MSINKVKSKFLFLRPSDFVSPRLQKVWEVAEELYDDVIYIGAIRSKDKKIKDNKYKIEQIGIYYPYSSWRYIYGTIIFIVCAVFKLIKEGPTVIHSSDFEASIPANLYCLFTKTKHIVNVHDNYFARYKVGRRVKRILKYLEALSYQKADLLLFPDEHRIDIFKPFEFKESFIFPNTPPDPGYAEPAKIESPIRLFVAGYNSRVRGLDMILELAKDERFKVLLAGRASDEDLEEIAKSKIDYYGQIAQKKVLELGKSCHLIPIFYRPDVQIHIYASPNKLYDAMSLGKPIIMNTGLLVSDMVKEKELGLLIEYGDSEAFKTGIFELTKNQKEYNTKCLALRKLYTENYSWRFYKEKLKQVFKELG